MNMLVLSDIHGSVEAVKELRRREGNDFDAILVAGDTVGFGHKRIEDIFSLLASFQCPVLYVLGNWDARLRGRSFGLSCLHIHMQPTEVQGYCVAGMDFGATGVAERRAFAAMIADKGPENCIVLTHDRLASTVDDMARVPLFVSGHRHKYQCTLWRGSRFLNPGALGAVRTVSLTGHAAAPLSELRNAIDASYAVVSIEGNGTMRIEQRVLAQDVTEYAPADGTFPAAPLLDAPFMR